MLEDSHYILSGAFGAPSLFLLRFVHPTSSFPAALEVVKTVPAKGPHQYLGLSRDLNTVYATSWALPPRLSAWRVEKSRDGGIDLALVNEVPISASDILIEFGIVLMLGLSGHLFLHLRHGPGRVLDGGSDRRSPSDRSEHRRIRREGPGGAVCS